MVSSSGVTRGCQGHLSSPELIVGTWRTSSRSRWRRSSCGSEDLTQLELYTPSSPTHSSHGHTHRRLLHPQQGLTHLGHLSPSTQLYTHSAPTPSSPRTIIPRTHSPHHHRDLHTGVTHLQLQSYPDPRQNAKFYLENHSFVHCDQVTFK